MSSSDLLFEVVDPRGILIVCLKKTWNQHIVPGHNMKEENVKNAICDPDIIYKSDTHHNRDVYFKSTSQPDIYDKVVVEVSQNYGEVATAFTRRGIRGGIDESQVLYSNLK